jgi:uncharacterized protein YgiM (DUF1202 family)
MRKFILMASFAAMSLATVATANAANMTMTMTKDTAVAIQPNANAKNVGTINAGTKVNVIETNGQWSHIQANGMDGYVPTGSLQK